MIYGTSITSIAKEAIYELSQDNSFKSLHIFPTEEIDIVELIAIMHDKFPDVIMITGTVGGVGDYVKQYVQTGVLFLAFNNTPVIHKLTMSNLEDESQHLNLSDFCFIHSSLKNKEISKLVGCLSKTYADTNFYGANHSLLFQDRSEQEILLVDYKEKIACKPFITNIHDSKMSEEFTVSKAENGHITEFSEDSAFNTFHSYFMSYTPNEIAILINSELNEVQLVSKNELSTNSCIKAGDKVQIIAKHGVTFKNEFLDLSKEVANEYDQNLIITCLTRLNAMIEANHLVDLEETKTKYFEGSGKEGFGFGSKKIFYGRGNEFKYQSHLLGMLGIKERS